jgi:DHA1 family tetracycline resistance protein-like MFS transporter
LIFPTLPGLLNELTGSADISLLYGVILALYALMQFVFSSLLGVLSDRYGRCPVLLLSAAGATVDYVFMALSPIIAVPLIGRAIAGITSANMAVATAYISDISEEQQRAEKVRPNERELRCRLHNRTGARRRARRHPSSPPFAVAAVLNAVNLALAFFMLPETRGNATTRLTMATLNPLAPMRGAFGLTMIVPMLGMLGLFGLIGNIPGTV